MPRKKAATKTAPDTNREAFDAIMEKQGSTTAVEDNPTRPDEYWRKTTPEDVAAAQPPRDEVEEPQEEVEAEEAPSEETAQPVQDQASYDDAVKALLMDGWSMEDIESLPRDAAIRVGKKRAENQADVSARLRAQRKDVDVSTDSGEQREPAVPTLGPEVAELFTPDVVADPEKLGAALNEAFKSFQGQVLDQMQQLDTKVSTQERKAQEEVQLVLDRTRRELVGDIPDLASDSAWDNVQGEMQAIMHSAKYRELQPDEALKAIVKDASSNLGLAMSDKESARAAAEVRDRATPTAPRRTSSKTPMTRQEKDRAAFDQAWKKNVG